MQILVDTSVWSLALRRPPDKLSRQETQRAEALREMIRDGLVRMIGPIRQELLSGVREAGQFEKLRELLRAFPDESITTEEYERAAQLSNECRRRGIAGSGVDFLICSLSVSRKWRIFTADSDYRAYARVTPIDLV